ncbi:MAG TPA: 50S ribosomal protein L9 [Rhodanobacteraceae bacterium]
MEVILLEKVANLGALGDKVHVRPGYGRNYLVPQGKAVPATKANLEAFEQKRTEYQAKADKLLADAQASAAKFADAETTISANASPEGKLFGSIGPREVAEALSAQGLSVEKRQVIMPEGAVHNVGDFDIEVSFHADVKVPVKVHVVAGT